jgi:hypothetical protein
VSALESTGAQHASAGLGGHAMPEAVALRSAAIVRLIRSLHFVPPRPPRPGLGRAAFACCVPPTTGLRVTRVTLVAEPSGGGAAGCLTRLERGDERAPTDTAEWALFAATSLLTCPNEVQIQALRRVGEGVLRSGFTPDPGPATIGSSVRKRRGADPVSGPSFAFSTGVDVAVDATTAEEAFGLVDGAQELWTRCSDVLRAQVSEAVWHTTFNGTDAVELHDDTLVLSVPSTLVKERIEVRYLTLVHSALADAGANGVDLQIKVDTGTGSDDSAANDTALGAIDLTDSSSVTSDNGGSNADVTVREREDVNPRYTFEAFVIGTSNRFAHAAALSVAETPARSYNPLFIYGDAGLGKTHLLQAIAHYVGENYPSFVVRYVTTETFLNQFVDAIRANAMADFKKRYREVDVLLLDDIQFIEKSEQLL